MSNSFQATLAIEEYDPENYDFKKKGHKVEANVTDEGIRLRLVTPGIPEGDQPDIYLEARADGWHVFAHKTGEEEPSAKLFIPNKGEPAAIPLEA